MTIAVSCPTCRGSGVNHVQYEEVTNFSAASPPLVVQRDVTVKCWYCDGQRIVYVKDEEIEE